MSDSNLLESWSVGVDEAGRGCLCGPVMAAAVILDPSKRILGLMDSKKISEKKRMHLFEEIQAKARYFAIAEASAQEIDEHNILQASLLAMRRAVDALNLTKMRHCLNVKVDGNQLPDWIYRSEAIVKGDQLVAEISAASILAKVSRDKVMLAYDKQYPDLGLAKHKGYPTSAHRNNLIRYIRSNLSNVKSTLDMRVALPSIYRHTFKLL